MHFSSVTGNLVYQIEANVGLVDGYPKSISEVFPGLPNDIDAGFYYPGNARTYFFKVSSTKSKKNVG